MTKHAKLSIKIHDKTQLETVLSYDFASWNKKSFFESKQKYDVDVYFFFPPQLNINKNSYSKEDFYEDIRPLIRLKEPSYTIEQLLSSGEFEKQSPFDFIKEKFDSFLAGDSPVDKQSLITELKILSCSLATYTSRTSRELVKEMKTLGKKDKNKEELSAFFLKASSIAKNLFLVFRSWQEIYNLFSEIEIESLKEISKETALLDENLLTVFYRAVSRLVFSFEKYFSSDSSDKNLVFSRRVRAFLRLILFHYKKKKYFFLTVESSRYEKESYSMRLAYLKKRMWQTLYLEVKDKASLFKRRQLAYIAAAGFAAMWALVANILMWQKLNFQGYSSFFDYSDGLWGFSTYLLVLAFISAYILKDRIKDFGREKFQKGLFRNLPDTTEQIWYNDERAKKRFSIGTIHESQQYLENSLEVPLEVKKIRSNRLKEKFIDQEAIIHYHKKILLDTRKIKQLGKDLTAIRDIIRLSVKRYVTRLDDPEEASYFLAKEGLMKLAMLPKVYYIDLVVKYSKKSSYSQSQEVIFECRRLILNKDGLVRIVSS